jgi:hypothetical protein
MGWESARSPFLITSRGWESMWARPTSMILISSHAQRTFFFRARLGIHGDQGVDTSSLRTISVPKEGTHYQGIKALNPTTIPRLVAKYNEPPIQSKSL